MPISVLRSLYFLFTNYFRPWEINMEANRIEGEHIIELNTASRFLQAAAAGLLSSGDTIAVDNIAVGFYQHALVEPLPINTPPMVGGVQSRLPLTRLMNALGSRENGAHIVLLIGGLNGMKSRVCKEAQCLNYR
jgi:hypothetical protein